MPAVVARHLCFGRSAEGEMPLGKVGLIIDKTVRANIRR